MQQAKYSHGLAVSYKDKIMLIELNAYEKRNPFLRPMYADICNILSAAAKNDQITTVVITGAKDFFSSGAVFHNSDDSSDADLETKTFFEQRFFNMIAAFIEFPKLLIALVNGPAIGIGATICALCDLVWCVDTAYFQTPFTKLAICPEACSSYLFPLILGRSKATELLLLSERLSAAEAYQFQFVSRVYKACELEDVWKKIKTYSELPPLSLMASKRLLRLHSSPHEFAALKNEIPELLKRFKTEEFFQAMIAFIARHNKTNSKL